MFKGAALVIGASGGIGQECVKQLRGSDRYSKVYGVSRSEPAHPLEGVDYKVVQSEDENEVAALCKEFASDDLQFTLVICCIGALHGTSKQDMTVMPEKRLEDINTNNLNFYFQTNTILPAIWLKNLEPLMKGKEPASLVFFSARVGSISDNRLGGWYGYRASKAALNMLLKSAQVECQRRAKNISLISYHPGTVDTELSAPFQGNVPKDKLFTSEFTVSQLLQLIPPLLAENGPHYIDWQGKTIPW